MEYKITVSIYCQRPKWVHDGDYLISEATPKKFRNSVYRLYFDNELLTERTWEYDDSEYIKEMIVVDIPPNTDHRIKIQPILLNPAQAVFTLKNPLVKHGPKNHEVISQHEIKFTAFDKDSA